MTRLEFMKELEGLLFNIPLEEREEALSFYNGYFDDAGEDQEEAIINELGSPSRVAAMIKADLNQDKGLEKASGYFTENGYKEHINNEYEMVQAERIRTERTEQSAYRNSNSSYTAKNSSQDYSRQASYSADSRESKNSNNTGLLLLLLFTFPFWLPILLTVIVSFFGIAVGIFATMFGIIVALGISGIAMAATGIFLFIAGLVKIAVPFVGLLLIGSGLLVFGIGMLLTLVTVMICRYVVPPIVEGFVNLCRLPFKNRRVIA